MAIGALSPVSAASWASRVADRTIRPSAGTMSPASSWTMSPGTTSVAGTSVSGTVAHHPRLRHLHLGQGVDAGAGGELLPGAQADVEHHEQGDEHPGGHLADQRG